MASAFGHAAASISLGYLGILPKPNWKLLLLGMLLAILPDADSIGFLFGIPYDSFWGHRGFSHSILFAFIVSFLTAIIFRFEPNKKVNVFFFLLLSCLSHSILDAMTTGGLGVAFFSPFDNSRYFFPFRPIMVSPINVKSFIYGKGLAVLKSEFIWIGIPLLGILSIRYLVQTKFNKR
ncbi:MAG: metal-dependent hydrolase [Bacteroidia bacterium]|nr:metal-dependent hydrolase [Bacteroidia bacterium]MCF8426324.1 metal-dependent hydrolase [Bacteroidia bacterium]MCF8445777.1 metal-dependent hydrolase [Bacteroidia bacterium]